MAEKTTIKAPAESKAEDIRTMSIDRKMLELQKSVRALDKDSENKHFNYRFVSGSKLLGVVRPKMDDLGLTLTQTIIPDSIEKTGNSIFMLLSFVWHDAYTGQTREDLWPAYGTNNSLDKAIGCAMTYAERYYIMKQLHIATDEDDVDGMEPVQPQQPARAQAKPAQPRQMETKPEQAKTEQAKKVRLTVESYQQGLCEAIDYIKSLINQVMRETGVDKVKGDLGYSFQTYTSDTTTVNKPNLFAKYEQSLMDAMAKAGIPAYVTATLNASSSIAREVGLQEGDEDIFERHLTPTVKFGKPRASKTE